MYFEYSQYVRSCLILPLFVTVFFLIILFSCISQFFGMRFHNNIHSIDIAKLLLTVLVCTFFLCMNIGRILHGGIHLIYERDSDAIEIQGEISNIEELGRFSFPELKTDYGYGETNGVQFTINGIKCSAALQGNLNVGDNVTVIYLPQSGYILSIVKNSFPQSD